MLAKILKKIKLDVETWQLLHGAFIAAAIIIDEITARVMKWANKDSRTREGSRKSTLLLRALDISAHL